MHKIASHVLGIKHGKFNISHKKVLFYTNRLNKSFLNNRESEISEEADK